MNKKNFPKLREILVVLLRRFDRLISFVSYLQIPSLALHKVQFFAVTDSCYHRSLMIHSRVAVMFQEGSLL